jgi:hypothetical protein
MRSHYAEAMLRKATILASLATLAITVAGCGSHASRSATSPTARGSITRGQAASIYLADVAPVNAQGVRLGQEFTSSLSDAQLAQDAKPFVAAAQQVDRQFLALARRYPAAATALQTEVTADAALISGLQDPARHLTTRELQDDIVATHTAANAARARLGLPQHQ